MFKKAFVVVGAIALILCGAVQTGMMDSSCDASSQLVSNHSGGWWSW